MKNGCNLSCVPPVDRWNMDACYSPEHGSDSSVYARFGYYLDRIDAFDASFFRLPHSEALLLDPHARMLLEDTEVLFSTLLPFSDPCYRQLT